MVHARKCRPVMLVLQELHAINFKVEQDIDLLLKRKLPHSDVIYDQTSSAVPVDLWSLQYSSNDGIMTVILKTEGNRYYSCTSLALSHRM